MYARIASYYKWNDARNRRMVLPRPRDLFFWVSKWQCQGRSYITKVYKAKGIIYVCSRSVCPLGVLFWSWKIHVFPILARSLVARLDKPHKNRNDLHDERILGTWIGTGGRALTLRIRSGDVGEHLKSRMSINITIYIYYIRIWEYIR